MNVTVRRAGWAGVGALASAFAIALSGSFGATGLAQTTGAQGSAQGVRSDLVKRGEYLVLSLGCTDCHSPQLMGPEGPYPDPARHLSGHPADMTLPPPPQPSGPWIASFTDSGTAWAGPWGISYTRNLTPDKETGLGTWTEEQFIQTLRTGRQQGRGRQILPPMPWPVYGKLNDDDLKAIYAYLQSIPAIKNKVPDPVIAEPPPGQ